jgi:hypothetical protein
LEADASDDAIEVADRIYSGMIIVEAEGKYRGAAVRGWRAAQASDATSTTLKFYVANSDYDAFDVQAAGGLTAYDLSDNYVVETGYFAGSTNFTADAKLSVGDHGVLALADEGDIVVAQVAEVGTNANGTVPYDGFTPSVSAVNANYLVAAAAHTGVVVA